MQSILGAKQDFIDQILIERTANKSTAEKTQVDSSKAVNFSSVGSIDDLAEALKRQAEMKKDGTVTLLDSKDGYKKQ